MIVKAWIGTLMLALLLSGCGHSGKETASTESPRIGIEEQTSEKVAEDEKMRLSVNDAELDVAWENNDSVAALRELAQQGPVTISMSMYGGFEQVGSIGTSLPRNDVQTTTSPGDIVLYSGNQMVVFYGSNSWAYTRLGKISDKSEAELTGLLGGGNVTITIRME